jgi:hypothetical protein
LKKLTVADTKILEASTAYQGPIGTYTLDLAGKCAYHPEILLLDMNGSAADLRANPSENAAQNRGTNLVTRVP